MARLPDEPITTPRLLLRPVAEADLDDLMRVNGDPAVTQHLPYSAWQTREDALAWLARMNAITDAGSGVQWVLQHRDDGRVIGTLLLFRFDAGSARAEIGYVLGRRHQGRGLMSEAVDALCRQAFGALGLRRIEAEVRPANTASCALLRRVGFVREGLLRSRWVSRGEAYDTQIWSRLADDPAPVLRPGAVAADPMMPFQNRPADPR